MLKYSAGITDKINIRRAHPSAGARFPLEIYPLVMIPTEGMNAGLYHYNIKNNLLDVLWENSFSQIDIAQLFTYEWMQHASIVIIITAKFARNEIKYGERGYRYILLEAGHIGQNLCLAARALHLKCCAIGGIRDKNIEHLLDIDGETESLVYALAIG